LADEAVERFRSDQPGEAVTRVSFWRQGDGGLTVTVCSAVCRSRDSEDL
jgi:hypothetical protein